MPATTCMIIKFGLNSITIDRKQDIVYNILKYGYPYHEDYR